MLRTGTRCPPQRRRPSGGCCVDVWRRTPRIGSTRGRGAARDRRRRGRARRSGGRVGSVSGLGLAGVEVGVGRRGRGGDPDARPAAARLLRLRATVVATTVTVRGLGVAMPACILQSRPTGKAWCSRADTPVSRCCCAATSTASSRFPSRARQVEATCSSRPTACRFGFETASELWTAPLEGGAPRRLIPNVPLRGAAWGADARIVVGRVGSGLWISCPPPVASRCN